MADFVYMAVFALRILRTKQTACFGQKYSALPVADTAELAVQQTPDEFKRHFVAQNESLVSMSRRLSHRRCDNRINEKIKRKGHRKVSFLRWRHILEPLTAGDRFKCRGS